MEVQCSPLTALLLSLWGLLERLQQWKSATERGQPCETTVSPSASMGRGSGDASDSMAFKQQEPWPSAVGLCSIGWHYRGHGRARVVITKGQFREIVLPFLGFNKTNMISVL